MPKDFYNLLANQNVSATNMLQDISTNWLQIKSIKNREAEFNSFQSANGSIRLNQYNIACMGSSEL